MSYLLEVTGDSFLLTDLDYGITGMYIKFKGKTKLAEMFQTNDFIKI